MIIDNKNGVKFELDIPNNYCKMTEDEMNKYYSKSLSYAFIEKDTSSVFCVIDDCVTLSENEIIDRILGYQYAYQRMAPGFQMGEMLQQNINGKLVVILTFKSNAISRNLFNIIALTSVNDKELKLFFTCDLKQTESKIKEFISIIESLRCFEEGDKIDRSRA